MDVTILTHVSYKRGGVMGPIRIYVYVPVIANIMCTANLDCAFVRVLSLMHKRAVLAQDDYRQNFSILLFGVCVRSARNLCFPFWGVAKSSINSIRFELIGLEIW